MRTRSARLVTCLTTALLVASCHVYAEDAVSGHGGGGAGGGASIGNAPTLSGVNVTANRAPDVVSSLGAGAMIGMTSGQHFGPPLQVSKSPSSIPTLARVTVNAKADREEPSCDHPQPQVGDPVVLSSGAKVESATDFALPGEMGLQFTRYYNSNYYIPGSNVRMGVWTTSYDYVLTEDVNQDPACNINTSPEICPMVLIRPDGSIVEFSTGTANPDGTVSYQQLHNGIAALTQNGDGSFLVHDEDSRVFTYSSQRSVGWAVTGFNRQLLSIKDQAGVGWNFSYPDANTTIVAHTSGQTVTLHTDFNAAGAGGSDINRQLTVTDPAGNVYIYGTVDPMSNWNYTYQGYLVGELRSVTLPGSPVKTVTYTYDDGVYGGPYHYALTGVAYNGVLHDQTSYDGHGRAIHTQMADGTEQTSISYDSNDVGPLASVTNALGHTNVYQFNQNLDVVSVAGQASAQCVATFQSRTYDANGNVQSETDNNGNVTHYTYAANGEILQKVEAVGTPYQRVTDFAWDTTPHTDRLTSVTVEGALQTTFTYTPEGRLASVTQTNLTANGVPGESHQIVYAYATYASGMVQYVATTMPSTGNTTLDTYDELGNLVSVTDGLGRVTSYSGHDGLGRLTRMTNPNGVITDFTYTALGWPTSQAIRTHADGSASPSDATTTYGYDNFPYSVVTSITDPDGVVTRFDYDASQRLSKITDASGNSKQYLLDAMGNRYAEQVFNASGQATYITSRQFSELGQVVGINVSSGLRMITYTYDRNGNVTDALDASGIDTHYTYDPLNRVASVIRNFNGGDPATANTTTSFGYDVQDRLTYVTDPNALTTSYARDGFGEIWSLSSPDSGLTQNSYDAAGRLIRRTDARGVVSTYGYDSLDRLTAVVYPAHPELNVTYQYDQPNAVPGCPENYNVGHLTSMFDASGSTTWCYTAQGDIREVRQVINDTAYLHGYAYTAARRLQWQQYSSGFELLYGRDANGQIAHIDFRQEPGPFGGYSNGDLTPLITNVSYAPFGPMTGYSWAQGGQAVSRWYDGNYWMNDLISTGGLDYHFLHDGMGHITAEYDPATGAANESYTFDPLYRLVVINNANATQTVYHYNATGDRLTRSTYGQPDVNYGYDAGTHRLNAVGDQPRLTDAAGNTVAMTSPNGELIDLGYDDRNLLTTVTRGDATIANYQYNGLGTRVWRTITWPTAGQAATIYDPFGSGNLFGEYFASDYREYVYLNGIPVAATTNAGTQPATQLQYLHADQNGTLRAATDPQGNQTYAWSWFNNTFGEALSTGASTFYNRYPGQYYDVETGLYYNIHRYYDPTTGRYIQSDPVGLAGGVNTYTYVQGRPLDLIDPTGLDAWAPGLYPPGTFPSNATTGRDYIHASVGLYVGTFSAALSKSGTLFIGYGAAHADPKSATSGKLGFSITAGKMTGCPKTGDQVDNFLTGASTGASAFFGVGGAYAANSAGSAFEAGFGTPGGSFQAVEVLTPVMQTGISW
jgi:RHS repeat-associated protein